MQAVCVAFLDVPGGQGIMVVLLGVGMYPGLASTQAVPSVDAKAVGDGHGVQALASGA